MRGSYDWIIDASGAPCVTSRLYSFQAAYFHEYLLAYQFVLGGDFSALMPRLKFAFFEDLPARLQPAYYWVFPKDAQSANVGVVCSMRGSPGGHGPDLKKLLADVLCREGLQEYGIIEKGGGVATSRIMPRLVYDNIILAGDAAGLTSPLHGGGIDLACLSGVLAVEALADGDSGTEGYRPRLMGYVRRKLAVEALAIRKMRTLDFDAFDALLGGVCSRSNLRRAATALRHPALALATLKWLLHRETAPDGPA